MSRAKFLAKFQNLKFWQFFKICNFDFVLFWLGIWCESLVWVIMGRLGVSQNAGVLVDPVWQENLPRIVPIFTVFSIDPRNPMLWHGGLTNFHTKIFQLERHRLKMDEKIIDSLSNLHLPIKCIFPYSLCKFHIVPPRLHMGNPDFFVPRWRMLLGFCASAILTE